MRFVTVLLYAFLFCLSHFRVTPFLVVACLDGKMERIQFFKKASLQVKSPKFVHIYKDCESFCTAAVNFILLLSLPSLKSSLKLLKHF